MIIFIRNEVTDICKGVCESDLFVDVVIVYLFCTAQQRGNGTFCRCKPKLLQFFA